MKGLYLHFFGFREYSGISKKIYSQIEAFKANGVDMELCYVDIDKIGNQKRVVQNFVLDDFGNGLISKFGKWTIFGNTKKYILSKNIDFVYVRSFYNTNPFLFYMFYSLRRQGVKVLIEYPTYPYDKETKSEHYRYQPIFLLHRLSRPFLRFFVDRVITFSDLDYIEGVKTIKISNAIDFNSLPVLNKRPEIVSSFNMIAVAEIHFWHGYDRVIRGLYNYYRDGDGTLNIHFYIAGDGSDVDREELKKLTTDLQLDDRVHFLGNIHGKDLDSLFELGHIAIASLGRHRSGVYNLKTLKNREYAARGIPFVYSEIDTDFENMSYIHKVPANDSDIDIPSLVDFVSRCKMSPEEIRATIYPELSWNNQIKKVVQSIS